MYTKMIHLKVRKQDDGLTWENRPVVSMLDTTGRTSEQVKKAVLLVGKVHEGVEVRWNYAGSEQGHYVFVK